MKGPLGGTPWRTPDTPRPFPPAPSWCHVCGLHYAPHPGKPCPTCEEN